MTTPSPIDDFEAPEELTARAISPGSTPLVHGYDVQCDLVAHYDFAEIVFTTLAGRAPEHQEGRCINVLLSFLLPICVAEAPSHGAVIARLCGAQTNRVIAAAGVALCEQSRFELDRHSPLLGWLERGRPGSAPPGSTRSTDSESDAVRNLHEHLSKAGLPANTKDKDLSLVAAIIAGLHGCGLGLGWQIEALWCIARLPAIAAESMQVTPGRFGEYPIRQPPFEFERKSYDDDHG